jgi:hypothetical protein
VQDKDTQASPTLSTAIKIQPVSFGEFAAFARRRGLTAADLADRFRGRIETPVEFFNRVLSPHHSANVIPYRSVIELYLAAEAGRGAGPVCSCGCGRPVFDRKKYALPGCKTRVAREKVRDHQSLKTQLVDFVDARQRQNRVDGTLPLTGTEKR